MTSRFTSRKFLLALAGIVYAIAGVASGHLTYDQAAQVIQVTVGAYLAAEGITDAASAYGAAKSQTAVDAANAEKGGQP